MSHSRIVVLICSVFALQGCALFSKGEVTMRRYYTPELSAIRPSQAHSSSELRLGRVTAGVYISERIMFRESAYEVGFYDDRIWTEKPEAYLRRGLGRVLFEEQGLRSVVRGAGPTLDVELISFEEVKAPQHIGRVKLSFALSDERVVSLQQTITVDRPIIEQSPKNASTEASAVAQAMGEALRDAIYEVSNRVVGDLAKAPGAISPCPVATAP